MAVEFASASSQRISCGDITDAVDNWSLAQWVKPSPAKANGNIWACVGKGDLAGPDGYAIGIHFSNGYFSILNVSLDWYYVDGETPAANVWYHVIAVRSAGTWLMYINGVAKTLTASFPPFEAPNTPTTAFTIGSEYTFGRYADAILGETRFYERVLSAEEAALLASGYRGPLGGEKVWWSGDDLQGVTHPDGTTLTTSNILPDLSGNGNDGIPTNSPVARASQYPRWYPWTAWPNTFVEPDILFSASVSVSLSASAVLTTEIQMAASVSFGFSVAAQLTTEITLVGAVLLSLSATGFLTTKGPIAEGDVQFDKPVLANVHLYPPSGDAELEDY